MWLLISRKVKLILPIEFSLNDFLWIQRIQRIMTKSKSSMVTTDTLYLTADTLLDVVVKKNFPILSVSWCLFRVVSANASGVCSFSWNFDNFAVNSQKVGVQAPENIELKNWFPTWHSFHFFSLFTCRYFTTLSKSSSSINSKCSSFLKIDF